MANEDSVREEAGKWFKKLSDPNCATSKIVNARFRDREDTGGRPFDPEAILAMQVARAGSELEELNKAVELMSRRKRD